VQKESNRLPIKGTIRVEMKKIRCRRAQVLCAITIGTYVNYTNFKEYGKNK